MRLQGADIDVSAGTGFEGKKAVALVRLTVTPTGGEPVVVFMRPIEARAVGLDLIGAGHASIADIVLRVTARQHGLDGDGLIAMMRAVTEEELGEG